MKFFLHILKFILLAIIASCTIYFLFPKLHWQDSQKVYFIYGIILIGITVFITILRRTHKIFGSAKTFKTIVSVGILIFLLTSFMYAIAFQKYTFKCNWNDKFRFIKGDEPSRAVNILIIRNERSVPVVDLNTNDGICNAIYQWFPGKPEALWKPTSINSNKQKLFYLLLILTASLIISLFFFFELKLLEYNKKNNDDFRLNNYSLKLPEEFKQNIGTLIGNGDTEKALNKLENYLKEKRSDNLDDLLLIKSRFKIIIKKQNIGTIESKNVDLRISQINESILNFLKFM